MIMITRITMNHRGKGVLPEGGGRSAVGLTVYYLLVGATRGAPRPRGLRSEKYGVGLTCIYTCVYIYI